MDGSRTTWDVVIPPNTKAVLHFRGDVTTGIMEAGKDIRQSSGVTPILGDDGSAIYEAGAGTYSFTIQR